MFKNILIPIFSKKQQKIKATTEQEYYRELEIDVLARTLFGEARGEPIEGVEAVACVVLNRARISEVKGRYWWGNGIIGVCQKPYQFSCWNRNDPSYQRLINVSAEDIHFATCLRIARRAVIGALKDVTKGATHYHANYVDPYWARGETPVKIIGAHLFYKLVSV
jgi:spore germination cell wall hydrolase CwlJ-like protein